MIEVVGLDLFGFAWCRSFLECCGVTCAEGLPGHPVPSWSIDGPTDKNSVGAQRLMHAKTACAAALRRRSQGSKATVIHVQIANSDGF